MARRTTPKTRSRKTSKKRRKRPFEEIGEGLQKELDAIVAPIGMGEKESPGRPGALIERTPDEVVLKEMPEHEGGEGAESVPENGGKVPRRRPYCWGIVIGETD